MKTVWGLGIAAALAIASGASAANFVVDAAANSSAGGTGLSSLSFTAGQAFTVSVNPNDLWSAGALPRWSNANGLTGNTFATGTDESGQVAGTQIGSNFGLYTQGDLSAPYGSLVGEINGSFRLLGTNYAGTAWGTGTLKLFYWDSNNSDNSQFILASVNAVPEPESWALLIVGFGLVGAAARRRRVTLAG